MRGARLLAAGLAAMPAAAAGSAPGWRHGMLEDGETCFVAREYAGSRLLVVLAHRSGELWIGAGSDRWPLDKADYPVRAGLDGAAGRHTNATPRISDGRRGFLLEVDSEFMRRLPKARRFDLSFGDSRPEVFDLSGAAVALERLRECLIREQAWTPPAGTTIGTVYDPFRLGQPFPRPARALRDIASLLTDEDYPAYAIRAGESGTVRFGIHVGPDGIATDCGMIVSSGSDALDRATCRLARARGRFIPARDASGRRIAGTFTGAVSWRLSAEEE